jgi:hypothetical protein
MQQDMQDAGRPVPCGIGTAGARASNLNDEKDKVAVGGLVLETHHCALAAVLRDLE